MEEAHKLSYLSRPATVDNSTYTTTPNQKKDSVR
jgi:hypothetical protein